MHRQTGGLGVLSSEERSRVEKGRGPSHQARPPHPTPTLPCQRKHVVGREGSHQSRERGGGGGGVAGGVQED